MKRTFMFFAAAIMMGAAVVSCDKSSSTNNNGGDEGEGEVPTESIAIDGNFEDWDACKTAVVATLPADATDKVALKTVKFTSDADYIYCYAEFVNNLPALEKIDPSWDGNGAWNTGGLAKELTLFIDTDANPKTGMVYREVGPFNQIGFEVACELYQYIAVETGKINLGWSQYNYWDPSDERAKVQGEVPEDGHPYEWPPYLWGTDNLGNLDNTLVVRSDFQARLVGTVVKEEFAISRDAMDQLRGQNKVNISVLSYGGEKYAKALYGYLPQGGDKQYITLELM
ncbi:MAG: hypothetical protein UDS46_08855 [Bacteroidales bacterium]|nr:hypothetical protein [Bacteroidales bacterium]